MAKEKEPVPVEKRKREPKAFRWDPDLLDAVDDWRGSQEVPPSDISVIETAVKAWLSDRGFWPRKAKKPGHS